MKIRTDFVTNSSSSSFVIATKYLTEKQIEQIEDHINVARQLIDEDGIPQFGYCYDEDKWDIDVDIYRVSGFTIMDNFDMYSFLKKIGVPDDVIRWDE